ncbi:MAG: hypothetical protein M1409_08145, partial [Actinobacteria bacterium]|nr:hypothetical protein [Actinomycetota bacterium]
MHAKSFDYITSTTPIILFILDICAFALFEKQLMYGLLCLFCLQMFKPFTLGRIGLSTGLLSIESFFYYGRFGVQLIYLVPLAIIGFIAQELIYENRVQSYIMLI